MREFKILGNHTTLKRIDWTAKGPEELDLKCHELEIAGYEITVKPIGGRSINTGGFKSEFFKEVTNLINDFLISQGAKSRRLHTWVSGSVYVSWDGWLNWSAPNQVKLTNDQSSELGKSLYKDVQDLMKKHNLTVVEFHTSTNDEFGYFVTCNIPYYKCIQRPSG